MAYSIDTLTVPNSFGIKNIGGREGYNTLIYSAEGYDIERPIEVLVNKLTGGGYSAHLSIPGLSTFVAAFGGTPQQAAYRMFVRMEEKMSLGCLDDIFFNEKDMDLIKDRLAKTSH